MFDEMNFVTYFSRADVKEVFSNLLEAFTPHVRKQLTDVQYSGCFLW